MLGSGSDASTVRREGADVEFAEYKGRKAPEAVAKEFGEYREEGEKKTEGAVVDLLFIPISHGT